MRSLPAYPTVHASPIRAALSALIRERLIMLAVLVASAIFLFADYQVAPIVLWDESRNIVNALEMHRTGLSLVTTYEFRPDLWNTKPPLMIWLMTGSIAIFGPSEAALRLPSTLAALGTILLVLMFVRRATGSIGTAALAAVMLVISPGFYGEHGARTADYDMLLLFFTTAYLFLLFFTLHRRVPRAAPLLLAAGAIGCAVLTKSVAGILPGLGLVPYLLSTRRTNRLWRTPHHALLALAVLMPVLAWFGIRELEAPGYLAAVWDNDVAGRFSRSLVGERKPWVFYLHQLSAGFFSVPLLALASPLALALPQLPARSRLVLIHSLSIAATLLVIVSVAASKLSHYLLPALPFMAIAAAIAFRTLIARVLPGRLLRDRLAATVLIGAAALPLVVAADSAVAAFRDRYDPDQQISGPRLYGALFARLATERPATITVIDPGFALDGNPHYAPILRAYRLVWAERGLTIAHDIDPARLDRLSNGIVASCDETIVEPLRSRGRDLAQTPGCIAIRVTAAYPFKGSSEFTPRAANTQR